MSSVYVCHRIDCVPRRWSDAAASMASDGAERIGKEGGALFGLWRSQIGLPRDTVIALTVWPDEESATDKAPLLQQGLATVRASGCEVLHPTTLPKTDEPPTRQGNYAFRWFETPAENFDEFLELCIAAWPDFESSYDSQIIGLWRIAGEGAMVRSLLLTRRPDLAMWERSKIPANEIEAEMREKLNRRYDLCDWTAVITMTLITAEDRKDEARWA